MKSVDKRPLVSVIMPIYNGSKYMAEAIDSILNQTYKKFELIIVNDNSTDSTLEILKSYKKRYPKIKIISLNSRHGPFGAINLAMKSAKGEFIAPMDSDDISHPKRLEKEVQFLLNNEDVIAVGAYARIINGEGEVIGKKTFATKHDDIYRQFFEVHPIVHPSSMIRRSLLPKKNAIYYNKFGINDDYFTFFNFLTYGKFANIGEFLFDYRIHLKNNSLQKLKGKFLNTVKIRLIAVTKLGYKPSITSLIKFSGQIMIIPLLPESWLYTLFLISKGIYSPQNKLAKLMQKINFSFIKVKSPSLSFKTT
ncbi:MAG: glycosyltransferase [Patescibacteria group bacterium]|nr:glycosyltransferase [Patescibacteria group bacterium]